MRQITINLNINLTLCVALGMLLTSYRWSHAEDSLLVPKVAVANSQDAEAIAYILQHEAGSIMRLEQSGVSKKQNAIKRVCATTATHVTDAALMNGNREILIACDQPPRLIQQSLIGGTPKEIALPGAPARLSLSRELNGNQYVCVSLPTLNSLWISTVGPATDINSASGKTVRLTFSPKEILPLARSTFIVADAYGNRLSIVDGEVLREAKMWTLPGYHFSGMALDEAQASILLTHQTLSSNARTELNDVRWGNLIQNNVASIPLPSLLMDKTGLNTDTIYRLGEFGHGSADPAGAVAIGDRFAVAVSGTDEVGFYSKTTNQTRYASVGHAPERLFRFGPNRLLCVHRLDQRIAVIDCTGDVPRVERMFGEPPNADTPVARGELAFFSGKLSQEGWMSCNSCHIEGKSPDILVDTLGDDTFDSPKKIPSLLNVAQTGPWGWNGGHQSLAEQVTKTLANTMHTPEELADSTEFSRETLVDDLVAYMSTIQSPRHVVTAEHASSAATTAAEHLVAGEALFQQHCARCHDPERHFTSSQNFDVGINDERGRKLFNPPSLVGASTRTRFMHDGRYATLQQVIASHPQPTPALTPQEQSQLKSYLESL